MNNLNVIEFHRTRDFSRKLNATFEFIKQNFKPLGKSIVLIAGPPILIASLILGSFMNDFNVFTGSAALGQSQVLETYFTSVTFWLEIALMIIFYTLSSVMNIATINNYLLLYGERRTNNIAVAEVWIRVRATFWMYFRSMFLFMFLLVIAYVVLLIPMFVLVAVSPFLMIIGVFFVFGALIYLLVGASLTFIIRAYERNGFFEAVGRSFKLVKDKWWSTFGLVTILYFIMLVTSYIFIMPWYFVAAASAIHNVSANTFQEPSSSYQLITVVVFTLYYLVQMVLAALPMIGIAFQYFNLLELKEAKGLISQIETIGKTSPSAPAQEEHY